MTTSVLSPLAQPFHPVMGEVAYPTIFNNGLPSIVVSSSEHDFLIEMITDETLDEAFPPSAQDAAELEAVEFFVSMMANFALLEEREEATRSLHSGLKKRWEARRGLTGKPRAPMYSVQPVSHSRARLIDNHELVPVDKAPLHMENRMRAKEQHTLGSKTRNCIKTGSLKHQRKMPIHQPRKNY